MDASRSLMTLAVSSTASVDLRNPCILEAGLQKTSTFGPALDRATNDDVAHLIPWLTYTNV
jgi:hypothetical protein